MRTGTEFSIPDLNLGLTGLGVLLDVHVDGEMGVDVAHLVEEAAGDTDDQVVDEGADGTEGSDTLASTVVQLDRDDALLGAAEGDGNVGKVLYELAAGTLDGHNARTNVNLHYRERKSRISPNSFFRPSFAQSMPFTKPGEKFLVVVVGLWHPPGNGVVLSHGSRPDSWPCAMSTILGATDPTIPSISSKNRKSRMLTIVRNGQQFLGVNVPHLDCVGVVGRGGELSISRGSKFGLELLVERNCHGIVRRLGLDPG